jgi:hypothetical protein
MPVNGPIWEQLDSIGGFSDVQVAQANAVALTTNVSANVASITLPPGDWNISGVAAFIPAATTSITMLSGGSSTTSATLDTSLAATAAQNIAAVVPTAIPQYIPLPVRRLVLTQTTTVYLVARATFTVSTLGAFGVMWARRASTQGA